MYEPIINSLLSRIEETIKMVYWIGFGHGAVAAALLLLLVFVLFGRRS